MSRRSCSTTRRLHAIIAGLIALLSASANGNAQCKQGDTPLPQFDVISVKPNNSGGPSPMSISPGRASLTNITLRTLIQVAYQVQHLSWSECRTG